MKLEGIDEFFFVGVGGVEWCGYVFMMVMVVFNKKVLV